MTLPLSANPLKDYQWKNRILLIHPNADETQNQLLRKLLKEEQATLSERDLLVFDLSGEALDWPDVISFQPKQRDELRKKFAITSDESTFILLGKDGGEKARQKGALNLKELLILIDGMPMRKAEMKAKK